MAEVKVIDQFKEESSKKFGIRPQHAIEVITNPDQTADFEQDGLLLKIHSKYIKQTKPPSYLIVIESVKDGGSTIHYALRAYPDLCENFTDLAPNDMLEAIVERFGVDIQVGAFTGKFIWMAQIPIKSKNDIFSVSAQVPLPQSPSLQVFYKIDKGPPMVAHVSFAFCLYIDTYIEWLNTHPKENLITTDTSFIIFKYRPINKRLLESLINSELHFSLPKDLNDPFDCSVDIHKALERAISRSQGEVRSILESLNSMNGFIEKAQKLLGQARVCCFSWMSENSLMWSHYADEHRGISLKYTIPTSFIRNPANKITGIGPVSYGPNPLSDWFIDEAINFGYLDDRFLFDLLVKALTIKAKTWEHEQEIRIIRKAEGNLTVDRQFLTAVCYGLRTPESDVSSVRNILDSFDDYKVEYFRVVPSTESDFELDVEEI